MLLAALAAFGDIVQRLLERASSLHFCSGAVMAYNVSSPSQLQGCPAAALNDLDAKPTPQPDGKSQPPSSLPTDNAPAFHVAAADPLADEPHRAAVQRIVAQVRAFHARGQPFRIAHGSTNSTRPPHARGTAVVNTGPLARVLRVDVAARTALVEPNVPMDRLIEATLPHGLVPPVVPEFPGITAGGAYAGTAGESSSFRHGFFSDTCRSAEMVLADGAVVRCSRAERPDLFAGAAGAVGTLGVATAVEVDLIPASKYVVTTYHPVSSVEEAASKIAGFVKEDEVDYMDGILFSATQGAVITGVMVDVAPEGARVQRFSGRGDPWFFMHVRDSLFPKSASLPSKPASVAVAIPLAEYLFRYDRCGFWVGIEAFGYFKGLVPMTLWTRWLLDDLLHTRMMYTAFHASGYNARMVIQDVSLPFETAPDFVRWADRATGIYPLWLCPLKGPGAPTWHPFILPNPGEAEKETASAGTGDEMLLNVGLWGPGPGKRSDFVALNRAIEAKVAELRGTKLLYAQTFYSEDEFWSIYDKRWYEDLREKYGATGLPSVWEKVRMKDEQAKGWRGRVKALWPVTALWGVWKAWRSGSHREARRSAWKSM